MTLGTRGALDKSGNARAGATGGRTPRAWLPRPSRRTSTHERWTDGAAAGYAERRVMVA